MGVTGQGQGNGQGQDPAARACIAVDAGNSKTDVAVVDADGAVLGAARGGGFQPQTVGARAAVDGLERIVREALAASGSAAGGPTGRAAHVAACLANADLPCEERELTAEIEGRGWARTAYVANDTFAILRAGLPDGGVGEGLDEEFGGEFGGEFGEGFDEVVADGPVRHGVAVVCGTGVNCAGRDGEGRTHRFPALGRISGDFGGGGGLTGEALWLAARSDDGRGERTRLAQALPAYYGLASMYELIEALHLGRLPRSRMHELTPLLFEIADGGDRVARDLVRRQADELVAMVHVSLTRLDLLTTPTPVLLGGSIAASRHPLLHDRFTRELAARAPKAIPRVVTAAPVLGAALLGLDELGARPGAYERLRAHYARQD